MTQHVDRRAHRYPAAAVAIVLSLGVLALGCSSNTSSTSSPSTVNGTEAPQKVVPGGRLIFGVAGESDGFLPQANRFGPSAIEIARAVMDPLVVLGQDGNDHPYLATAIYPSKPDFTEWEIKARPEAKFHNGEVFDGEALRVNLQAFKDSALTSAAMKPITSITVVDPVTVRLAMNAPWANFPTLFTSQAGFIAAPAEIKAGDGLKPIGTGPFKFTSWSPGSPFKTVKNPDYWQKGLPYLDEVEFRAIQDGDSRRKALEANDIDIAHTNSSSELQRDVKDNDPPQNTKVLVDEGEGDEYLVVLNTQTGPFVDKNLRIALAKATDKEGLLASQFDNYFESADGPYAKNSAWYTPSGAHAFDLPGAKKLVDEYKAAHGGQAPTFKYTTIITSEDQALAQVLQQQWQAAGFVVSLEAQDEAKFSATIVFGQAEAFAFKFFNNPDPDGEYYFWSNDSIGPAGGISLNFPRYPSDVVQSSLDIGRRSVDPAARKAAYANVWKDWAENVPYIFIFHAKWALVYNKRVHGVGDASAPDGAKIPPILWGTTFLTKTWIDQSAR